MVGLHLQKTLQKTPQSPVQIVTRVRDRVRRRCCWSYLLLIAQWEGPRILLARGRSQVKVTAIEGASVFTRIRPTGRIGARVLPDGESLDRIPNVIVLRELGTNLADVEVSV